MIEFMNYDYFYTIIAYHNMIYINTIFPKYNVIYDNYIGGVTLYVHYIFNKFPDDHILFKEYCPMPLCN